MSELLIDCYNYVTTHKEYGFEDKPEQDVWDWLYSLDKDKMSKLIYKMSEK